MWWWWSRRRKVLSRRDPSEAGERLNHASHIKRDPPYQKLKRYGAETSHARNSLCLEMYLQVSFESCLIS